LFLNQKLFKQHIHIHFMEECEELEIPTCEKCGSKQIRTTKKFRICIRCGNKEEI